MNLLSNISSKVLCAAMLFAMVLLCVCCSKEIDQRPINANLRLVFAVPSDTKAVTTQDYADANNNEGVDNLIVPSDLGVYFFDTYGNFIYFVDGSKHIDITPFSDSQYNPHYHLYNADMYVEGVINGYQYRIVVVANQRLQNPSQMPFSLHSRVNPKAPAGYDGTDEQYLYSQLEMGTFTSPLRHNTRIPEYTRFNLMGYDNATVPMWGVQQVQAKLVLNPEIETLVPSGQIDMLRSIAKVKVALAPELSNYVRLTDYIADNSDHGFVLRYSRDNAYMTPKYDDAKASSTWNSLGQDKDKGKYSNLHVNAPGADEISGLPYAMPMYKHSDGSYYAYLPEQKIGESYMSLEFKYIDVHSSTPVFVNKKLQFADYDAAIEARGEVLGDAPLTEDELKDFLFPVMRNHYYIYTIIKIDPLELKLEVCDWEEKSTSMEFN